MATEPPPHVKAYHRAADFTELTIPKGLLANHSTKPGVWGVIHVTAGALLYTISATSRAQVLQSGDTALIEPEAEHLVSPQGTVCFFVEFHK